VIASVYLFYFYLLAYKQDCGKSYMRIWLKFLQKVRFG